MGRGLPQYFRVFQLEKMTKLLKRDKTKKIVGTLLSNTGATCAAHLIVWNFWRTDKKPCRVFLYDIKRYCCSHCLGPENFSDGLRFPNKWKLGKISSIRLIIVHVQFHCCFQKSHWDQPWLIRMQISSGNCVLYQITWRPISPDFIVSFSIKLFIIDCRQ